MMKIKSFGIAENVYNRIEDWLRDREQRVVLLGCYSEWISVKSGVAQGPVLGSLLFLIYINDIDESVSSKLLTLADDTKVFRVVTNANDIEKLQLDLIHLCKWSNDWLMLFNVNKCKIVHFGFNNTLASYQLNDINLVVDKEERNLGVIIQNDLKCTQQCIKVVNTANKVLCMIRGSFMCKDREIILQLCKALVRPHLEYCVQAWRPHLQKEIDFIERVQRRATKVISNLKNKSYEERLSILSLTTLQTRRVRGDLIEVFKMCKGFDNLYPRLFLKFCTAPTRGHTLKLFKPRCHLDIGKFSFAHRVIDAWNSLNDNIIACNSLNGFKNKTDKCLKGRGFI
jgi:ribonucleases P/MRP protein subunit RPP40